MNNNLNDDTNLDDNELDDNELELSDDLLNQLEDAVLKDLENESKRLEEDPNAPPTPIENTVVFSLDANPKQKEFFNAVITAMMRQSEYRFFFFGGAVRGGKTAISLFILHFICINYPNIKCHVIRDTFPSLEKTTIPSFVKFFGESTKIKRWHKDKSNYYVEYHNGAKIFFLGENFERDKDFDRFKGLETNIFLLEQIEELHPKLFLKAIERCGSHYIAKNPPGIILATFNPTVGWLKKDIYEKAINGTLLPPYYYLNALPTDNAYVTEDQWANWNQLDEVSYNRFIKGDWSAKDSTNLFLYAFDEDKHVNDVEAVYNPALPLWLTFDFNISPCTCLMCQFTNNSFYVIREISVLNASISQLCEKIKKTPEYQKALTIFVTGDPAGRNRSSLSGNTNSYKIIQEVLKIKTTNFKVLSSHPRLDASITLCNSIVERHPNIKFNKTNCPLLIEDIQNVKAQDVLSNKAMKENGHFLDCLRYIFHQVLHDFLKNPIKDIYHEVVYDPTNVYKEEEDIDDVYN